MDDLMIAVSAGDLRKTRQLLFSGADPNARDSRSFESVLSVAAGAGYEEIVKVLLSHGAYPGSFVVASMTPLQCAAKAGHIKIVEMLLERGANINEYDGWDLEENDCPEFGSGLEAAAYGGNVPVIRLLLDKGADVDLVTKGRYGTPLISAAAGGHVNQVLLLLDLGVEINSKNESGDSGADLRSASEARGRHSSLVRKGGGSKRGGRRGQYCSPGLVSSLLRP